MERNEVIKLVADGVAAATPAVEQRKRISASRLVLKARLGSLMKQSKHYDRDWNTCQKAAVYVDQADGEITSEQATELVANLES